MKPFSIILIVFLIILLFNITVPGQKASPNVLALDPSKQAINKGNILSVSEEDVLIENRGPPIKVTGDFPIPQTTTQSKSLSTNYPEDLSIITNGATAQQMVSAKDTINIDRVGDKVSQVSHIPHYYRKDNMSGSTIDTTEYGFAEVNNLKSSHAWSDENVSQYPGFYTSQVKDELTNVGAFFDINNQFVDTTKPRSTANVNDICYTSSEGEKVCLDNSRLHNVPPSLVSDINNCGFLNSIGLLEYSNSINETTERVNNGGYLYDKVKGSKQYNEVYSEPIKQPVMNCQI